MINKFIHFITCPLNIFQPFKVLSIVKIIENLEKEKEFEKADKLRTEWIQKVKFKNSAPLLFSRGTYHLYYTKKYQIAFFSFENAITAFERQILHCSAVNPLELYYGCSVSAIMIGRIDKGEEYFKGVMKYYNLIASGKNISEYAKSYAKRIEWIKEQLDRNVA